jgi:hypothetical protein
MKTMGDGFYEHDWNFLSDLEDFEMPGDVVVQGI